MQEVPDTWEELETSSVSTEAGSLKCEWWPNMSLQAPGSEEDSKDSKSRFHRDLQNLNKDGSFRSTAGSAKRPSTVLDQAVAKWQRHGVADVEARIRPVSKSCRGVSRGLTS